MMTSRSYVVSFVVVTCLVTRVSASLTASLPRAVTRVTDLNITAQEQVELLKAAEELIVKCLLRGGDVRLLVAPQCHALANPLTTSLHRRAVVVIRAAKRAELGIMETAHTLATRGMRTKAEEMWPARTEVQADAVVLTAGSVCGHVLSSSVEDWDPRGNAVLVLLGSAEDARKELHLLFNHFQAINVAAVTSQREVITCNPYSNSCFTYGLRKKNICSFAFPNKVRNLHGTVINISMFHEIPHALALDERNKTHFTGADPSLMNSIMKHLNAVPRIVVTNDNYGERLPNGSFTGSSGDVISGKAELAFNSRNLKTDRLHALEYLYPHHQSDMFIFVANSLPLPAYATLWLTLEPSCWAALAGAVPLAAVVWHAVRLGTHTQVGNGGKNGSRPSASVTFLHSVKVLLGDSLDTDPDARAERAFYQSWLWFTLLARTIFLGSFSSHLATRHYAQPISSIEEWYDSGLRLAVFSSLFNLTIECEGGGRKFLVNERMVLRKPDYVHTIITHRNLSAMTRINKIEWELRQRAHVSRVDDRPLLHVVPERLMMTHVQYEAQKHSPLVPRVNTLLLRLVQGGLFRKWFGDTLDAGVARGKLVPRSAASATSSATSVLEVEHIQAAVLVLAAGLSTAAVAFVVEQLHYRFVAANRHRIVAEVHPEGERIHPSSLD